MEISVVTLSVHKCSSEENIRWSVFLRFLSLPEIVCCSPVPELRSCKGKLGICDTRLFNLSVGTTINAYLFCMQNNFMFVYRF